MPLVDRQTVSFFIIMFIFLSLPNGGDQPHSNKDKNTLELYQDSIRTALKEQLNSEYDLGYGNITGLELSYQDNIDNKNILDWPLHEYSKKNPWVEDEKFSLLPNEVSSKVKSFWSTDPILENDSNAYLLNISGRAYGEFERVKTNKKLKPFEMNLPKYLYDFYESYTEGKYEEDKEKYEQDPESNSPPQKPERNIDKVGNFTYSTGKISLKINNYDYNYKSPEYLNAINVLEEEGIKDAVLVKLDINLLDYPEIDDNEIGTLGVYFQDTGSLISLTRSAKFFGYYGLQHFTMNQDFFDKSKIIMGQFSNTTDITKDVSMDKMTNRIQQSQNECEFITYFQFDRTDYLKQELMEIDEELMNPTGKPITSDIPNLRIKESLLYSPDCGVLLQSKLNEKFEGKKAEVTTLQVKKVLSVLLMLTLLQLYLLIKEIKRNKTPGQLSNISSTSISILSFQDSLIALILLLFSTLVEDLYLILACVAVIAFLMCGVFELRFLVSILTTQANERGTTWWEIFRGSIERNNDNNNNNNTTDNNNVESGLPLPVTAGAPGNTNPATTNATTTTTQQPIINDEARYSNSIFGTGCTITVITTILILNAILWRIKFRRIFECLGLFMINSYWLSQFSRNTLKNRRKSFLWEFIIGTSIIRLLPIGYLCLNKSNPFRHHYNPVLITVLVIWVSLQIILLYLQEIWGARFWINENWLPKAYDYHYLLNIEDLESGKGFGSDILSNLNNEISIGNQGVENNDDNEDINGNGIVHCKIDCTICMNEIDLPINTSTNSDGTKLINQIDKLKCKDYMITPCHHIFHTQCLEDWMVYKLQCPVCRTGLPPV